MCFAPPGFRSCVPIVADRREGRARHLMEPPYVIKPVNEGSSVGIYVIPKG